ncbi:ABC transporter permease [Paenibacillus sp. J31TS4]|uniref:putative ABC transporter permease subunit n=1 Tax=Paenibacillus sp. J31TS4 TaxID=2807195 RepID=UPI001B07E3CB|nr:hypothetical protein [Paenibacillus sp. J31TS4]GIP38677.1 ABC transporter permease [Paenibacillus sp. J31TS4]
MIKTLVLARVLLKNGTGRSKKGRRGSKLPLHLLLPVVLVVAFLPLMLTISRFLGMMYDSLAPHGQQGIIVGLAVGLVSLMVFLFGLIYVINVFFFSQDVEHLLPLPLTPREILSAKFLVTLLYEYLTAFLVLGPVLITYGVKSGGGPLYYIYSLLVFLLLPVIPLVVASVLAMIIMRFTNMAKHKDRYRTIGGTLAVVFALGANLFFQRGARNGVDPEQLQEMLIAGDNSMVRLVTGMFPSSRMAADALTRTSSLGGLASLLLFAGVTVLLYLLFLALGRKLYFRSVMGLSESSAKRAAVTSEQLARETAPRTAFASYLLKELRILFRTPPYFLNCVLMSVLWPVIISIPLLAQGGALPFGSLSDMLLESGAGGLVLAGGVGLFLFVSGGNYTAPTALSREGAGLYVNKFLPIRPRVLLLAKLATGWLLTMVTVVLLLVVGLFVLHVPPLLLLLLLVLGAAASLFSCLTGILIDLHLPKLNWDTEQKAVKQNLNGLYNMLLCILLAVLLFFAVLKLDIGMWGSFGVLLVIMLAADYALYRVLVTKGEEWFRNIEQ